MNRRERTAVLAGARTEDVKEVAGEIREACEIQILKQPQKTLVMVKVRESVKKSLFYLGEVLATECMVTVNGIKGASVMAGDDFEKCISAAIIDGFLNDDRNDRGMIIEKIEKLKENQEKAREKLNRQLRKSKVNFNVMGEQ